jgi:zinc/manganese transport system permease protein
MIEMLGMLTLPFLACIVFGVALSYFGFQVLKREVIFIDIALAQVAAVGSLVAHLAFDAEEDSLLAYAFSFALIALVALFYAVTRKHIVQISIEAVIGLSYAITAAAAMFLIGVATGHHVHAEEMLAGKLLWVTWPYLIACLIVAIIVFALVLLFRKPFHETSADYDRAVAQGRKVVWWDFLFYLLLGALITLFVPVAGVVVVFAFLILPATTAVLIAQSVRAQMFVAWIVLAIGSAAGLAFSYRFDFSVGPPVALFLGITLATVAIVRRLSNLRRQPDRTSVS